MAESAGLFGALPTRTVFPRGQGRDQADSQSSSSTNSPAPVDHEESDFWHGGNDSQSSLGVPNIEDIQVEDDCYPPVDRLPNEILIGIFAKVNTPSDLYNCLLVSKRWARNAIDLLWHRPSCTTMEKLDSICSTLALEQSFFSYRDFIKRLNLAALASKVTDESVAPLAVCRRIERLTLTNCEDLTDDGVTALVRDSASLLALDISSDKNITEASINAISEHCKRLQGLNVSGCLNISNQSMLNLAKSCRYIKRLKLNDCTQMRDNAIHAFAENCPNMLEIDLHQCNMIGNGPVTSLLAKGNCLRELRLANCDLVDDSAFLTLPPNKTYEHLRILDLTSCSRLTDLAVIKITEVAPRLRNLVLAKCRNITDVAVNAIATLGKNLHYVHLGHCSQITDEGVKALVQNCSRIRYIDLGCCNNLTDESVKRLSLLPKLKRIGLVKCNHITDDSVLQLAEAAYRPRVKRDITGVSISGEYYATSLERVHLSYCVNLTIKSILRLLNSCPRLTHLSLTGVAAFQRDEFHPFCRPAPPEFTQNQRDVFCVFSGSNVSSFRKYLNTAPEFKDLRVSMTQRPLERWRSPRHTQTWNHQPNVGGDAYDDDMGDDNDDLGQMEPHEFGNEAQGLSEPLPHAPGYPLAPPLAYSGFPGSINFQSALAQLMHTTEQQQNRGLATGDWDETSQLSPLNFSSFINNEPAIGTPPLSARGQASMASLTNSATQAFPGQAEGSTSASMASLHYQQEQHANVQNDSLPSDPN